MRRSGGCQGLATPTDSLRYRAAGAAVGACVYMLDTRAPMGKQPPMSATRPSTSVARASDLVKVFTARSLLQKHARALALRERPLV